MCPLWHRGSVSAPICPNPPKLQMWHLTFLLRRGWRRSDWRIRNNSVRYPCLCLWTVPLCLFVYAPSCLCWITSNQTQSPANFNLQLKAVTKKYFVTKPNWNNNNRMTFSGFSYLGIKQTKISQKRHQRCMLHHWYFQWLFLSALFVFFLLLSVWEDEVIKWYVEVIKWKSCQGIQITKW